MNVEDHPSKRIIGTESDYLSDKRIILVITGSIAAIKAPELARKLMRMGADVIPVMTDAAQRIITPETMEWATGNEVITHLTGKIEHVYYTGEGDRKADLVIVAPATANTISKIANGISDNPATAIVSCALGMNIDVLIVPCMHISLYRNPIFKEQMEKIKELRNVKVLEPRIEEDKAKFPSIDEIVDEVLKMLYYRQDMVGVKVLVTAGPTHEYIDSIRFIGNPSSGRMGIEIARVATLRGANVKLIYGPGTEVVPKNVETVNVVSHDDMLTSVMRELNEGDYDVFISAAAISDFKPEKVFEGKISSENYEEISLRLIRTPKVIEKVREADDSIVIVSFKAEYKVSDEELLKSSLEKVRKGIDLVVANDVSRPKAGFGKDTNEVMIVRKDGTHLKLPPMKKTKVAEVILDEVLNLLKERGVRK
ncbi:MAG: bifunctional phosphopantothenoylcysteine decarboxylase/phosphopantothenate--cysteine ligase CoaBC [Candidatus Asgardarchaeia archaeon]